MFTKTTWCICGNESGDFSIDNEDLAFLDTLAAQKRVYTAIATARIVWGNLLNSAHPRTTKICKMETH